MAPMSDEERLIEAVAAGIAWENTTKRPCEPHAEFRMRMQEDKVWMRGEAETRIQSMRLAGITLTMPPAPEPTYTITLSEKQRGMVVEAVISKNTPRWSESQEGEDAWDELYEMIISTLPDPEPGT